jgi:hypothetical protein
MRRIAMAVLAVNLMTGGVALAQIAGDMSDDSTSAGVQAMHSTHVKPRRSHPMFDDASLFDSMARYPMSSDPMSKGILGKDVYPKMRTDGSETTGKSSQ